MKACGLSVRLLACAHEHTTPPFSRCGVPAELRSRLKSVAARRGVSLQQLVGDTIEELLAREEAEPPKLAEVMATFARTRRSSAGAASSTFTCSARSRAAMPASTATSIWRSTWIRTAGSRSSLKDRLPTTSSDGLRRGVDLGERESPCARHCAPSSSAMRFRSSDVGRHGPPAGRTGSATSCGALERIERRVRTVGATTDADLDDDTVSIVAWSLLVIG